MLPEYIRKKLEGRETLQQAMDNTAWMMGDQVARQVVGLLVGVWLARYLGPQQFGQLSYAFAVVLIVSPVAMLALDEISIRRMARDPACRDEILGTSFVLMLAAGLLAYILTMATILFSRPDDHLVLWLVGILAASIIVQAFIAIEFWFESQMQWKHTVYAKTSAFMLVNVVKIVLILLKTPLIVFAWIGLAETVAGSLGLLMVYRYRGFSIRAWRFSRAVAKTLLRDSWPLVFSTILTMIYLRIDQIMIGNMIGSEELGVYSVAVRISEAWYFIPSVISSAVFPVIVKTEALSEHLFYTQMQKLYNWMALLAYGVALPVAYFSEEVIHLLFSAAYMNAAPLLAILIWAGVFISLGAARQVFIVSKNRTRVNLVSIASGSALNVVLNYVLIPLHGAMGAAAATFISYWFAVHGTCFLLKPLRKTGWMMTKAMIFPKVW